MIVDEWSPLDALGQRMMTHQAEQPNPVPPIVEAVRRYLQSGNYDPVHEPGTQPADYLRELARNPDILAKNIEQASQFNFGGTIKPTKGSVPLTTIGKEVPAPQAPPEGITAYHGSPHDFEKFDLSKIGTGEGAQAYGHGLYFAENEGVAKAYRDVVGGKPLPANNMTEEAAKSLIRYRGGHEGAISYVEDQLKNGLETSRLTGASNQDVLDLLKSGYGKDAGKMYQVAIKADPEHFLDWDKPVSEQAPKVQEMLKKVGVAIDNRPLQTAMDDLALEGKKITDPDTAGLYQTNASKVAKTLSEAGIPGIRYLDQQSRGAFDLTDLRRSLEYWKKNPESPGATERIQEVERAIKEEQNKPRTSNYVVFDDKTIDILKKYGLLGLFTGGAASQGLPNAGQQYGPQ